MILYRKRIPSETWRLESEPNTVSILKLKIARSKVKSSTDGFKKRLYTQKKRKLVNWKTEL